MKKCTNCGDNIPEQEKYYYEVQDDIMGFLEGFACGGKIICKTCNGFRMLKNIKY